MLRRMPRHALLRPLEPQRKAALNLGFRMQASLDEADRVAAIRMIPESDAARHRTKQVFEEMGGNPEHHPEGVSFDVAKTWTPIEPRVEALNSCANEALERAKELMA
jgi:hypothetical protein